MTVLILTLFTRQDFRISISNAKVSSWDVLGDKIIDFDLLYNC